MQEDGVMVSYNCENVQEKIVFRFVSLIEPKLIDSIVHIENMVIRSDLGLKPKISKQDYPKYLGELGTAYTIDYEIEKMKNVVSNFEFTFKERSNNYGKHV